MTFHSITQEFNQLDEQLKEKLKQLVVARIKTISNEVRISLGSQDFSPDELIAHVEKEDEIGEEFINMHWQYLKDLASGALYGDE